MLNLYGPAIAAANFISQDIQPIVTDRPDFTESSVVVPLNSVQLESGLTIERTDRKLSSWRAPELLLRYGIAPKVELRLGLPNKNWVKQSGQNSITGLDDTYVGAKIQLGPTGNGVDYAIIPALVIPTGRKGIRAESLVPEIKFVYSFSVANNMTLSGMLHVSSSEENSKRMTAFQNTVSLGIPICENFVMFIEHAVDFVKGDSPAHLLHSGFTYQPKPNQQFDVHFGFGLTRSAPNHFVGIGYSIRL